MCIVIYWPDYYHLILLLKLETSNCTRTEAAKIWAILHYIIRIKLLNTCFAGDCYRDANSFGLKITYYGKWQSLDQVLSHNQWSTRFPWCGLSFPIIRKQNTNQDKWSKKEEKDKMIRSLMSQKTCSVKKNLATWCARKDWDSCGTDTVPPGVSPSVSWKAVGLARSQLPGPLNFVFVR